jgi:hypothetical protein
VSAATHSQACSILAQMTTTVAWIELPLDPTLLIFSYLDYSDLCSVAQVCHQWKQLSEHNEVWRPQINKYCLNVDKNVSSPNSLKSIFKQFYLQFGNYLSVYPRVNALFNTFSQWIETHFPKAKNLINKGASEEEIEEVEKVIGHKFPTG